MIEIEAPCAPLAHEATTSAAVASASTMRRCRRMRCAWVSILSSSWLPDPMLYIMRHRGNGRGLSNLIVAVAAYSPTLGSTPAINENEIA
jgi:hypothetical protein